MLRNRDPWAYEHGALGCRCSRDKAEARAHGRFLRFLHSRESSESCPKNMEQNILF